MAMTQCPECRKDVSDRGIVCPHCGNPLRAAAAPTAPRFVTIAKNSHPVLTAIGGFAVVLVVLAMVGHFTGNAEDTSAKTAPKPAPAARFVVTDVLMDEGCTQIGEYCITVHCTFKNEGDAAGQSRVRAHLRHKGTDRIMANHYSDLTLLPGGSQRLDFTFDEAELGWEVTSMCLVDPPAKS